MLCFRGGRLLVGGIFSHKVVLDVLYIYVAVSGIARCWQQVQKRSYFPSGEDSARSLAGSAASLLLTMSTLELLHKCSLGKRGLHYSCNCEIVARAFLGPAYPRSWRCAAVGRRISKNEYVKFLIDQEVIYQPGSAFVVITPDVAEWLAVSAKLVALNFACVNRIRTVRKRALDSGLVVPDGTFLVRARFERLYCQQCLFCKALQPSFVL